MAKKHSATTTADAKLGKVEPLAVSLADAEVMTGLSYKTIQRLVAADRMSAVKSGTKTLVLVDSIRSYLASLPPAKFAGSKAA